MTIVFLKFQLKNTQIRHFWSQIQAFSLFHDILQLEKFEGADFKYDNSFIKFQPKNTQIRHFWSQMQPFLFFSENLQIGKFEGADFKSDNSVFKMYAQKYPNNAFLVTNLRIFIFALNFATRQILRALILNMTTIFSKSSPEIQKSGIFGPKFKNFYFLHETL